MALFLRQSLYPLSYSQFVLQSLLIELTILPAEGYFGASSIDVVYGVVVDPNGVNVSV